MNIFDFKNYRDYLRDYVKSLGPSRKGELGRLSKALEISPTMLSQILSGQRTFNSDHACLLSKYLGLDELEEDFLYLLVQLERAGIKENRAYLQRKMNELKKERLKLSRKVSHDQKLGEKEQSVFYSSWLYSAIQIYTSLSKNGKSYEEISKKFGIKRVKAKNIGNFLLEAGLCVEKAGKLMTGTRSTYLEAGSPHLIKHHSNWRVKAIQRSDSIAETELMFTAPLSISKKDFLKVREKISHLISEVSDVVKTTKPEDVAFFNIDWAWLSDDGEELG